jgi:glyoxylase-like metal-dependent hydrolase (beta-lactamase superfamily II)
MRALVLFGFVLLMGDAVRGQEKRPALQISHLTGEIYVYTTWVMIGGAPFPANGLYLVTKKGVVVIDAPFDTTQFQPLVDSIFERHRQPVVLNIATHFHNDRTAALDFFRKRGVATYTTRLTDEYSRQKGERRAEFLFDKDTTFTIGGYPIQTFFPGEGHTRDNIVLWFGRDKVLFGGCLVKSVEAPGLGNLADANVAAWPESIRAVQRKYPQAVYVIPGHQGWEDTRGLQHTLDLLSGSVK